MPTIRDFSTRYIVTSRTNKKDKNQRDYAELKVASAKDNVFSLIVWGLSPNEAPQVGQTVQFEEILIDDFGRKCYKEKMFPGDNAISGDPLYDLVPHPISREDWDKCVDRLIELANSPIADEGLTPEVKQTLCDFFKQQAGALYKPYSCHPAATSVHHAFKGGLLNHTYQMLNMLAGIIPSLPYPIKIEYCAIAILFHDWGKLLEYNREGETQEYMYLLGHIYMSANYLNNLLRELLVNESDTVEVKAANKRTINFIVHCVLAHHGMLEYGSPVLPCTKEAALVTHLDNISAKEDTIENNPHMEYVRALSTHVVK